MFQTRINNTLSDPKQQEKGVPQGSILSVILFMIKINNITTCLPPEINGSLYVDDFLICNSSKNMVTIERKMQQCINKILKWTMKNGFKISCNKTKCMHFCQICKMHNQPTLTLNSSEISLHSNTNSWALLFTQNYTSSHTLNNWGSNATKLSNSSEP